MGTQAFCRRAAGGGVCSARPSTEHVDSLPLTSPARLRAAGHCTPAGTQAQGRGPPRTLPARAPGRRAEVTSAPKEMANRKCTCCNAETVQVPPPPHPTHPRPGPARLGGASGRENGAGVATPHPGPAPEVCASPPGHYFSGPNQPARAGPGPGLGLHAARVPLGWEPERRRGWRGLPGTLRAATPRVAGFRLGVLCPLWLRLRDAPSGTVITSGENS